MTAVRNRLEAWLASLARTIAHHPWIALLLVLAGMGVLIVQVPKLTFDPSTEGFFHPDDPAVLDYEAFRERYGRDEVLLVAIASDDIFSLPFLERLREFHEAVESDVPYLDDVASLINARNTRGEGNQLIVEDLLEELPDSPEAMAALRERVMANPIYRDQLISSDGKLTTVQIRTQAYADTGEADDGGFGEIDIDTASPDTKREFLTDAQNSAVVTATETLTKRFDGPGFRTHLAGSPAVTEFLKRHMQGDMSLFMRLALGIIAVLLLLLFRRATGVIFPLLSVLLGVGATIGLMAWTDTAFKLPTTILPSFLLAVGIGAGVHLLAIFYRHYDEGESKEAALVFAIEHSGLPIIMTSLTTAAGLLSFFTAAIAPIADLGIFAALGVLISLVLTLVLLPALLMVTPLRRRRHLDEGKPTPWSDRLLLGVADTATGHPWIVTGIAAVLLVAAVAGLTQLRFSHNTLAWLPESSALRQDSDLIDSKLNGSITVDLIADTGVENGLYEPAVMQGLEALGLAALEIQNTRGETPIGKTLSLADLLKEINRALNEDRPEAYAIPDSRELIAQELLLFENSGSDDLEDLVDSLFSQTRITAKLPWDDAAALVGVVDQLGLQARELLPQPMQITVTGVTTLLVHSISAVIDSMQVSYLIAAGVITVLMVLLLGSVRMGLLSMIPNLLPIVLTLGLMGWADIPLDAFTLLIGSIALGLAVDDTIHFFHNFGRYHAAHGNPREAARRTLLTTGRAMLFTTLVLVAGFWVFMFASMNNLFYFGLLTGMTLIVALLADAFLAPALLTLIQRKDAASAA